MWCHWLTLTHPLHSDKMELQNFIPVIQVTILINFWLSVFIISALHNHNYYFLDY